MTEGLGMTKPRTGPARLSRGPNGADDLAGPAAALDAADPLADFRDQFIGSDDPKIIAYLDGNSLGRPLRATRDRIGGFITEIWGSRLIRAWDEGWMDDPLRIGDQIGRVVLGAAPGQTVVGDSTSVMLYKWIRAALASQAGRDEIIVDVGNFPTDRFVVEGIAAELGMRLRWLEADRRGGVTVDDVAEAISSRTALILLSDVAYRSGYLADVAAITAMAHDHGALVLWDVCHSAGAVPRRLDDWRVDLAVGCTYKYLNGGPGSPAFGYVRADLQQRLRQPIQGWMGAAEPFAMAEHYTPSDGIRRFLSGTPSIIGMLAMEDMLALIEQAGLEAIRAKSVALTEFAIQVCDALLDPLGVQVASPRDSAVRGSHVTLEHPEFRAVTAQLWSLGVIPDFRPPDGLRIGLSPLSTSFGEVYRGLVAVREVLWQAAS
jgi:kynureninase